VRANLFEERRSLGIVALKEQSLRSHAPPAVGIIELRAQFLIARFAEIEFHRLVDVIGGHNAVDAAFVLSAFKVGYGPRPLRADNRGARLFCGTCRKDTMPRPGCWPG